MSEHIKVPDPSLYETQRRFGRLPSVDERDRRYRAATPRTDVVRKMHYDPPPILDQGSTSQCVIYSGDTLLSAAPVRNASFGTSTRRTQIYKEVQKLDEWEGENYEGTSVRAMMKWFQAKGLVKAYGWATEAEAVMRHVLAVAPMQVGLDWTTDMDRPDAKGYIWPKGKVVGGHAFVLIGADRARRNPDGTIGAFRMVNSWGSSWGQSGRAWLTMGSLQKLLDGLEGWPGEAATATEVKIAA
jgi:hypothetical protein